MSVHAEIATRSGLKLKVEKTEANDQVQVCLRTETGQKPLLHWGLRNHGEAAWRLPPPSSWPEGSKTSSGGAVDSPFTTQGGEDRLEIRLEKGADFSSIDFVLFFPDRNRWDNNRGRTTGL
jgi:alpha-glucan, water dikinase